MDALTLVGKSRNSVSCGCGQRPRKSDPKKAKRSFAQLYLWYQRRRRIKRKNSLLIFGVKYLRGFTPVPHKGIIPLTLVGKSRNSVSCVVRSGALRKVNPRKQNAVLRPTAQAIHGRSPKTNKNSLNAYLPPWFSPRGQVFYSYFTTFSLFVSPTMYCGRCFVSL